MTTKEKIEVMQYFENGGEVDFRFKAQKEVWVQNKQPVWNWAEYEYRIAPIEPLPQPLTREEITAQWVRDHDVKAGDMVMVLVDGPFLLKGSTYKVTDIKGYCIACEGYAEEREFNVEDIKKVTSKIVVFSFEDRELFRDKWVRPKGSTNEEYKLGVIANWGVAESIGDQSPSFSYENALKEIEFIDGKPFGKEVWE